MLLLLLRPHSASASKVALRRGKIGAYPGKLARGRLVLLTPLLVAPTTLVSSGMLGLSRVGATWTPGTPGLPIFSVTQALFSGNVLNAPHSIAVVGSTVWVTNNNNIISVFNLDGTVYGGGNLSGNSLNIPYGITVVGSTAWVANGISLGTISRFNLDGTVFAGGNLSGNGLSSPHSIAVLDTSVWVANNNNTISRFNLDGTVFAGGNLSGNGLSSPQGVTVVGSTVWVANSASSGTISRFNLDGTPYAGGNLSGNSLSYPHPIIVVGSTVWVANNNNTISLFNLDGTVYSDGNLAGNGLSNPAGLAVVGGAVWAVNHNSNSISLFTLGGLVLGSPLTNQVVASPTSASLTFSTTIAAIYTITDPSNGQTCTLTVTGPFGTGYVLSVGEVGTLGDLLLGLSLAVSLVPELPAAFLADPAFTVVSSALAEQETILETSALSQATILADNLLDQDGSTLHLALTALNMLTPTDLATLAANAYVLSLLDQEQVSDAATAAMQAYVTYLDMPLDTDQASVGSGTLVLSLIESLLAVEIRAASVAFSQGDATQTAYNLLLGVGIGASEQTRSLDTSVLNLAMALSDGTPLQDAPGTQQALVLLEGMILTDIASLATNATILSVIEQWSVTDGSSLQLGTSLLDQATASDLAQLGAGVTILSLLEALRTSDSVATGMAVSAGDGILASELVQIGALVWVIGVLDSLSSSDLLSSLAVHYVTAMNDPLLAAEGTSTAQGSSALDASPTSESRATTSAPFVTDAAHDTDLQVLLASLVTLVQENLTAFTDLGLASSPAPITNSASPRESVTQGLGTASAESLPWLDLAALALSLNPVDQSSLGHDDTATNLSLSPIIEVMTAYELLQLIFAKVLYTPFGRAHVIVANVLLARLSANITTRNTAFSLSRKSIETNVAGHDVVSDVTRQVVTI